MKTVPLNVFARRIRSGAYGKKAQMAYVNRVCDPAWLGHKLAHPSAVDAFAAVCTVPVLSEIAIMNPNSFGSCLP